MPLPESGPISFSDLNVEIGQGATEQLSMAFAAAEILGSPIGTETSMSDFYAEPGVSYPTDVYAYQSDTIGESVGVTWTEPASPSFTIVQYRIWVKVNSGSWGIRATINAPDDFYLDDGTQPGYTLSYRVQAVGTSQVSPSDADMDNFGTTYPPTAVVTTENTNPTS